MYFSFVLSLALKVSFTDADIVDRLKLAEKLRTHVLRSWNSRFSYHLCVINKLMKLSRVSFTILITCLVGKIENITRTETNVSE